MDLKFVFSIGNGRYALPVEVVDHTLPDVVTSLVPWMPEFHLGLFPYRGEIVPLLDLRIFLNESIEAADDQGSVLVLNSEEGRYATRVKQPQFLSVPDVEWPLHPEASIFPALDQVVELDGQTFTMLNAERLRIQVQRTLKDVFADFSAA
jgi:chemotaxis signal transduction protein